MKTDATALQQQAPEKAAEKATVTDINEYRVQQVLKSYAIIRNRHEDSCPSRVRVEELFSPTWCAVVIIRRRNGAREFYIDKAKE